MKIAYHLVPVNFKDLAEKTDKDIKDFVKDNCLHDKDALNDNQISKVSCQFQYLLQKRSFHLHQIGKVIS